MTDPYQCSGKNNTFSYAHLSYADYINTMQEVMRTTRPDYQVSNDESIITAAGPAEHVPSAQPSKVGVLLVHGLLDSAANMQSLFQHYQAKDYLVRSLLLPGHGTVPGDLLEVELEAWLSALNYAVACCKQQVEKLYIIGYSTGATLALYQSQLESICDGLILLAPAIGIKNRLAFVSQWHRSAWFLGDHSLWFSKSEENDFAKYRSITYNGVSQLYQLIKKNDQLNQQSKLTVPLFMVLTSDDETINSRAAQTYFEQQNHPSNQLLIYSKQAPTESANNVYYCNSHLPEQRILDFSHVCLAIDPNHPHYGQQGDYQDLYHYKQWWGKAFDKNKHLPLHYGAISKHNLCNYQLARLLYNPDFENMMARIDGFIDET